MNSTQKQLADTHYFIPCGHNVHLISRSLDNICHYCYLSGDVLLSLNKLDLNSSNVHTILAAIMGPMEVTYIMYLHKLYRNLFDGSIFFFFEILFSFVSKIPKF